MREELITDAFRNMMAYKIFSNEVIVVKFHRGEPGDDGRQNELGAGRGNLNMNPADWEVGDTGIIQNRNAMNVGLVTNTGTVPISYFSLWRENGDFLGFTKLLRTQRFRGGESLRISRGLIKYKF